MSSPRGGAGRLYLWLLSASVPAFLLGDFAAWPREATPRAALETFVLSVASAGTAALLALPLAWLGARGLGWLSGRAPPALVAAALAAIGFVLVSAGAWFVIWPNIRQSLHPDRALCLLAGAAAALIAYLAVRVQASSGRRWPVSVFFALVLAVVAALHVRLDPRKYIELHDLAELLLVLGAAALSAPLLGRPGFARRWQSLLGLTLPLLGVGLALRWDGAEAEWRAAGAQSNRLSRRLAALAAVIWDRDGDGHSPLLYPGDCDDADERSHPGAPETQGGADRNCNGHAALDAPAAFAAERAADEEHPPHPAAPSDVLLLSIDSFAPSLLAHMPELRKLAASGLQLQRCYAAGSATALSLPLFFRPSDRAPPVSERLVQAGVSVEGWLDHLTYPDIASVRSMPSSEEAIAGFLAAWASPSEQRRLAWLHLFDLHDWVHSAAAAPARGLAPGELSPVYASAGRELDRKLGVLFAALWESERGRAAWIIVTGDHGEGFGAHGFTSHGTSGYEEVLRTPCVVAGPGIAPQAYGGIASHRGLPATLLAAFGLASAAVDAEVLGRSWLRALHPGVTLQEFAVARSMRYVSGGIGHAPLAVLATPSFKLVEGVSDGGLELYDLAVDPGERNNLAPRGRRELGALRALLARAVDSDGFPSLEMYAYRDHLFGVTPR